MAEETNVLSLAERYFDAQTEFLRICDYEGESKTQEFQKEVKDLIRTLEGCHTLIANEALFSPNEEIDDIQTGSLQYALCPFYLSQLTDKLVVTVERIELINKSSDYLNAYLEQCDQWGLLRSIERKMYRDDRPMDRTTKIEHFKRKQQSKDRLQKLLAARSRYKSRSKTLDDDADSTFDEEEERQCQLLLIDNAIIDSLSALRTNKQELQLAEMMRTDRLDHERNRHSKDEKSEDQQTSSSARYMPRPQKPSANESLVTHIAADSTTMQYRNLREYREKLAAAETEADRRVIRLTDRREVFMNRAPPVQTLDGYLEQEFEAGTLMATTEETVIKDPYSEPTEEEEEKELRKTRDWDNWTDDHEKGAGNTKLR
eukprot:40032_1